MTCGQSSQYLFSLDYQLTTHVSCLLSHKLLETGIVDLHENGRIWAESKGEGKGCTFFVQLPLHSRNHVRSARHTHGSILDLSRSSVQNLLSGERDGKQSEAIVLSGSPIAVGGQAPVPLVVEDTWKPTVLVVDDSSMNRKVDIFTFLPSLSQSLSQSSCPHQCIISSSLSHQSTSLTHNSPPPPLDAGPHVEFQRICLS